jgi:hypothetical protein
MANAFAYRPPSGVIDVDEDQREDYHDGIQRGYRVLRSRILIANVLKNAGMLEKFQSIVDYVVSAHTPREPSQRGCPTVTGFNIKAGQFEDEVMELARKDSESSTEKLASLQLEEHKRNAFDDRVRGQLRIVVPTAIGKGPHSPLLVNALINPAVVSLVAKHLTVEENEVRESVERLKASDKPIW